MKIAFIVGSLEAGRDGVGDYTRALAQECVRQGHSCALLALNDRWLKSTEPVSETLDGARGTNIETMRLSQQIPWREKTLLAKKFLETFDPDWVSLQFVSYAFQSKGIVYNLAAHLRPLLEKRRVHVMFHELWIGDHTKAQRKEWMIGKAQKHFILQLTRRLNPSVVHTSICTYIHLLAQSGIDADLLPLFGNIPIVPSDAQWLYEEFEKTNIELTEANRNEWWTFGFFGSLSPAWPAEPLLSYIYQAAQHNNRQVLIASVGRVGDEDYWKLLAIEYSNRFHFLKLGERPVDKVSQYLQFLDFGIAAAPYGLIGKSGVAAAMTEHGLPVIVNRDDWHSRRENPTDEAAEPLLHKLDDTLQGKLISGIIRREPEHRLPQIARQFLEALGSSVV